jgi:large subunit ribosomal protein L22
VVDLIRGKGVDESLAVLQELPRGISPVLAKLLKSAVANAAQRPDVDIDALYISRAFVDEGPTLKRFRPRAMGRVSRVGKRSCHITVELDERPAAGRTRKVRGGGRKTRRKS